VAPGAPVEALETTGDLTVEGARPEVAIYERQQTGRAVVDGVDVALTSPALPGGPRFVPLVQRRVQDEQLVRCRPVGEGRQEAYL
jgi:hypothetical protein